VSPATALEIGVWLLYSLGVAAFVTLIVWAVYLAILGVRRCARALRPAPRAPVPAARDETTLVIRTPGPGLSRRSWPLDRSR